MLHDRILVSLEGEPGERKSGGGILIPATASIGKRLVWAHVVATGPHVRQVCVDDRVLFDPEDRAEVEFVARYRIGGGSVVRMREHSRFVREGGQWFYLEAVTG